MRMTAEQIRDYSQFSHYVSTAHSKEIKQKKILDALMNNSGASEEIIKDGLYWGKGTIVNVKMLVSQQRDGHVYTPTGGYTLHTNIIDVATADVGRYQTEQDMRKTALGQVHLITIILLHELTHWARERSETEESPDREDGFEFEKGAYGKIIER
jgi:Metallopeptidase toxin 3